MHDFKLISLILVLYLTWLPWCLAEEESFGRSIPSEEEVIGILKSDKDASSVGKTRSINIINSGNSKSKYKPIYPLAKENAISLQVVFEYKSAVLTTEAMQQLQPVGKALASNALKDMSFRIEGHTDAVGSDQYNLELSRQRADAVKKYLIEQFGVSDVPIQIIGMGKRNLADKDNPDSEVNRRVRIVSLDN